MSDGRGANNASELDVSLVVDIDDTVVEVVADESVVVVLIVDNAPTALLFALPEVSSNERPAISGVGGACFFKQKTFYFKHD